MHSTLSPRNPLPTILLAALFCGLAGIVLTLSAATARSQEPALFDLLVMAGVGDYRRRRAKHQPVLGTGDAPSTTVPGAAPKPVLPVTPEDRKAMALQEFGPTIAEALANQ